MRFDEALPEALAGERLDRIVAMLCDLPRDKAAKLISDGSVTVDGVVRMRRADRLETGAVVGLDVPEAPPVAVLTADSSVEVPVVHEDEHLVVVDKPAGLVVHPGSGHPTGTMVHGLLARYPEMAGVGEDFRPGIVHRLDRATSGLLVVARTADAHAALTDAMRARTVTRRYRTLVWGHLEHEGGQIDAPIGRSPRDPTKMGVVVGGRESRTDYDVVARYAEPVACSELICHLHTGRTHQIRVHLEALGHPVVGDPRYSGARSSLPAPRQFLHAEHLSFVHPITGAFVSCSSELPADLVAVLATVT